MGGQEHVAVCLGSQGGQRWLPDHPPSGRGQRRGRRGPNVSALLKKLELCLAGRELASLFLPQNEVFPVKNISVGITFLGQPFLTCLK